MKGIDKADPSITPALSWPGEAPVLEPAVDPLGRWSWPLPGHELVQVLRRSGSLRVLLRSWIEDLIAGVVPLSPNGVLPDSASQRIQRLDLFKQAAFGLHVEEHFTRTKRQRDRIIYSMLRCRSQSRLQELTLAIKEGEIDFAAAAIRYSEGPESSQGGRIGPISPQAGHPELNKRLDEANEGDLIGPFSIGDMHVLLRLDTRITNRLDEALQLQLIEELYEEWLDRQLSALEAGESIEPVEYLPIP